MAKGLTIQTFMGDDNASLINRRTNEIVLTVQETASGLIPFVNFVGVRTLAPTKQFFPVLEMERDDITLHARLARYDDQPAPAPGVYLCAIDVHAQSLGEAGFGYALATVHIDMALPTLPAPGGEDPRAPQPPYAPACASDAADV